MLFFFVLFWYGNFTAENIIRLKLTAMRKYLIAITAAMSLLSASAEVTYKYDESTKTVTFSGDGEMNVYTTDIFGDTYINPEWSNLKDELKNVYFSGITPLSFEQLKDVFAKSTEEADDVTIVVHCDALDAYKEVLTDMKVVCGNTAVDDIDADDVVVVVVDGRVSVDRDDFRIYDVLGRDVTSSNGSLTSGVYVVKCEGQTQKAVMR